MSLDDLLNFDDDDLTADLIGDADQKLSASDDAESQAPVSASKPVTTAESTSTTATQDQPLARVTDLGQSLLASNHVSTDVLASARGLVAKTPSRPLAEVLRESGVEETALAKAVAEEAGVTFERVQPDAHQLEAIKQFHKLTPEYCEDHGVLPLRQEGSRLVVGVIDPDDLILLDEVRHKLGANLKLVVVPKTDIDALVAGTREEDSGEDNISMDDLIAGVDEDDVSVVENNEENLDLEKMAGESPVIRYVNFLIFNAVKEGASDIHIEPQEKKVQIRYRIDGVMFEAQNPPPSMKAAIVSRIKIMANLDIAERRVPQDGRIRAMVHGRKLDLRVSTLPMVQGEKVVMRILDTKSIQVDLDDLGFSEDALQIWTNQIKNPHGIVLVTGPTGSGKTTTLYASLGKMDRQKLNISTAEDPVEYHLGGINQTPVNEKIGMSFAAALRALLRQDPDVIMVGEIRDFETAKTAVQASLTGHLVLSTLHTNDAPSSITRLVNIGVEPFLIGGAVNACLAQRLVRKICTNCKEMITPDPEIAEALEMQGIVGQIPKGAGCDKCRGTGYSGRLGIYELLVVNDALRDAIARNPSVIEFRRMCIEQGMTTLRRDGFDKVQKGLTTVDEILRVTEATI
ncbi:MAG: ATPase, T2SS/T4P/T4SS family [Planctomycetota bacterium]